MLAPDSGVLNGQGRDAGGWWREYTRGAIQSRTEDLCDWPIRWP